MNNARLDRLLEATLANGAIPPDASEFERAELAKLLRVATTLRERIPAVEAEANATMPIARARFGQYMARQQAIVQSPARDRRRGWPMALTSFFAATARLSATRAVAAIGAVAIVALFLSQVLTSDVGTASAQVLTPGDYVQLEGTVTAQTTDNGVRRVHLLSDAGEFDVEVSNDSSVVAGRVAGDVSAVQLGDHILVGGVVSKQGQVGARTLVVSGPHAAATKATPSPSARVKLRPAAPALEGRIVSFSLAVDLKTARVVLDDGKGGLFLARINRKAAETLLLHSANALGTRVRLVGGGAPGLFGLVVSDQQPPAAPGTGVTTGADPTSALPTATKVAVAATATTRTITPSSSPNAAVALDRSANAFVEVKGVIVGREANILRVQTERGLVLVVVRTDTRILTGDTGATRDGLLNGAFSPVGYTVGVAGGFEVKSDRISADVVILGPKPPAK